MKRGPIRITIRWGSTGIVDAGIYPRTPTVRRALRDGRLVWHKGDRMISRKHRFHGHGSLRFVYQRGETVRGPLMALKYIHNTRRVHYRLAVVVSKKVHKSAVARNRMRRRLYEAVRACETQITKPYDLVITVFHEQLLELTPDEVNTMVRAQLRQAGIIPAQTTTSRGKM